jgi:hypothetical protein
MEDRFLDECAGPVYDLAEDSFPETSMRWEVTVRKDKDLIKAAFRLDYHSLWDLI